MYSLWFSFYSILLTSKCAQSLCMRLGKLFSIFCRFKMREKLCRDETTIQISLLPKHFLIKLLLSYLQWVSKVWELEISNIQLHCSNMLQKGFKSTPLTEYRKERDVKKKQIYFCIWKSNAEFFLENHNDINICKHSRLKVKGGW